ncbi:hypothetical protein [Mucilaginibacter paludis]|uniref:hypothetical protein n=1 Tax=Mucilaginibacter paludis TaxID=423351 RepID=UPI0001E9C5A4|nr:hypothetical protein [Mucilaginibacter paludis]
MATENALRMRVSALQQDKAANPPVCSLIVVHTLSNNKHSPSNKKLNKKRKILGYLPFHQTLLLAYLNPDIFHGASKISSHNNDKKYN